MTRKEKWLVGVGALLLLAGQELWAEFGPWRVHPADVRAVLADGRPALVRCPGCTSRREGRSDCALCGAQAQVDGRALGRPILVVPDWLPSSYQLP